jgi:hypothetical protein
MESEALHSLGNLKVKKEVMSWKPCETEAPQKEGKGDQDPFKA